jgi:DNA-binding response OmpR family regulator
VTGQGQILLVEDDRFLRRACETSLRQRGLGVASATNGDDGLRLAQERPFDLIVLDWLIPEKTGIDVLTRLKTDPWTAAIPVLILSYSTREEHKCQAMDIGASGYFVKANLSLKTLGEEIERILS